MKKTFLTIITAAAFTFGAAAQSMPALVNTNNIIEAVTWQQLRDIDKQVQDIKDNTARYQKTEEMNNNIGFRFIYMSDGELKRVSVGGNDNRPSGMMLEKKVDWFFENNRLIYSESTWTDPATNQVVNNQKVYARPNERMLAWFINGEAISSLSDNFKAADTAMSPFMSRIRNQYIITGDK